MEQVTVPQFIEREDKILGPISVRQFVIIFVAAIILFVVYQITPFILFVFFALLICSATGILGFYEVNGQPFHLFLLHLTQTIRDPSLRVWRRRITKADIDIEHAQWQERLKAPEVESLRAGHPIATRQKLAELSLIVDTGGAYQGTHDADNELF